MFDYTRVNPTPPVSAQNSSNIAPTHMLSPSITVKI